MYFKLQDILWISPTQIQDTQNGAGCISKNFEKKDLVYGCRRCDKCGTQITLNSHFSREHQFGHKFQRKLPAVGSTKNLSCQSCPETFFNPKLKSILWKFTEEVVIADSEEKSANVSYVTADSNVIILQEHIVKVHKELW